MIAGAFRVLIGLFETAAIVAVWAGLLVGLFVAALDGCRLIPLAGRRR